MSAKASPALKVLTASNQRLSRISNVTCPSPRNEVAVLNADGNNLSTLSGIECYPALIQLSARDNSIVKMEDVRFIANLVTLNLQGNSITDIAGLEGLVNLQWVSLAGNTIMSMNGLDACVKLNYLDVSENCITELSDVTSLSFLKTLLLHGNAITSLQSVPRCLPKSLLTLSLAENEVSDLNEASFLRSLLHLEQLSLLNNPCVSITDARIFDFRPYVLFWCSTLTVLDGVEVTAEERQSSQALFPPSKPYPFALGEHHVLVHYLSSIYPIPSSPMEKGHGGLHGEKTTAMSLSELEGLLAQSSSKDQLGLISKLRALQLMEQMIATQEQLVGTEGKDGSAAKPPAEIKAESAVSKAGGDASPASNKALSMREVQYEKRDEKRADTEFTAGSDSSIGALSDIMSGGKEKRGLGPGEEGTLYHGSLERIKGGVCNSGAVEVKESSSAPSVLTTAPSTVESAQERGHKQLRLLNEKLAKRHSKLPRKEVMAGHSKGPGEAVTLPVRDSARFGSPSEGEKVTLLTQQSDDMSPQRKGGSAHFMEPIVSHELPGKSVALKSHSFPEPVVPMPKEYESGSHSTGAFVIDNPLPITLHPPTTPPEMDLLDSETSYLPVLPSDLSSSSHTVRAPDGQDTDFYVTSLLSSLDSAYGYSSLAEKSRLLSSLVGTGEVGVAGVEHRLDVSDLISTNEGDTSLFSQRLPTSALDADQAAVRIQAAYRGYICRERSKRYQKEVKAATLIQATWRGYVTRKRDAQVIMVRGEISRLKVEAFAHSLYTELQCCKQELAQQVELARLQADTLQTLLTEVKELQLWRSEVRGREREKAAVLLQRYWRGYMSRKRFPHIRRVLSQKLCRSHSTLHKQLTQLQTMMSGGGSHANHSQESHSYEGLPPVQDLQMSHHSDICILLEWTPPTAPPHGPSHPSSRLGYRVYVNGVAEGMVGPEKSKAYIEGLDVQTTYRITVRVVYSAGESEDSNPIIASLDPGPPPPRASHLLLKSAQTSDPTETGDLIDLTDMGGLTEMGDLTEDSRGKAPSSLPSSCSVPGDSSECEILTTTQFHNQSGGNDSLNSPSSLIPTHTSSLDLDPSEKSNIGVTSAVGGADVASWNSNSNTQHQFANKLVASPGVGGAQVSPDEASLRGHMFVASHTTHSPGSVSDGGARSLGTSSQKSTPIDPSSSFQSQTLSISGGFERGSTYLHHLPAGEGSLEGDTSCLGLKGEESGPCPDKPTEEGSLTQDPSTMTTVPSDTYPDSSALSLGTCGDVMSPHGAGVALQQPITTSSLIKNTTSSPFLPPLVSRHVPGYTFDILSPSAMQSASSALLNDPSLCETKWTPPFASTGVSVVSTLGVEYTSSLLPSPGAPTSAVVGPGAVHDMYRHSLNMMSKVTDNNPNPSSVLPPQVRQLHTTSDVTGSPPTSPLIVKGGEYSGTSVCASDESSDTPQSETIEKDTSAEVGAGVAEPSCDSAGESDELAAAASRQDECKQTNQLPSDYEKCFEEGKERPAVPRGDSGSIISLAEATATGPDNTRGSSPLQGQTMPLVPLKGQPQGLGALISEGVNSGCGAGEMRSASRSVHMASVLLSQLESELTNSLNEGKN